MKRRIRGLCGGLFLLWALLPASISLGQGAAREDRQAVESSLDPAEPTPRATPRPAIVDLRDKLPAVGEQSMNDCVGWAYGYAARTYLEALDQDWRPDHPTRIFSPTFIYNQINNGADKGSSPLEAVKLLRDQGAATLGTQPYLARDHLARVGTAAHDEAPNFRIADFGILENGEQVRDVLAAGYVVCIGVRTNPVFNSGRYDLYTPALHDAGIKQRRPDQPHGYHAMVIAGYDDHRRAFLFMNSWGQNWGERGYVWVSYDAADSFNLNRETEFLVDYAIVMVDRREPVVRTDAGYRVLTPDALQIAHRFRVTGLNDEGQPGYDLNLDLIGPAEMLRAIKSVRWTYPGPDGAATFDTAGPRAILSVTQRNLDVVADVTFADGRTVRQQQRIALPDAVKRDVSLRRIDAYSHDVQDVAQFRWTLVPQMSAQDWAALSRIVWHVTRPNAGQDPLLRPALQALGMPTAEAPVVYQHVQPSQPPTREPSLAYPSGINAAPPGGFARFVFADGNSIDVPVPANPLPPRPRDGSVFVTHLARPVGDFGGKTWWYVEAKAVVPERWHPFLVGASFTNEGRNHDFAKLPGVLTDGLEPLGFVAQDHAWFAYNIDVEVLMRRGPQRRLFERPLPRLTAERLIAGDLGTVRVINVPAAPVVSGVPGDLAGLRYADVYLGLDADGQPRWRFFPFFADTQWGRNFHRANDWDSWTFDDPGVELKELYDEPIGGMPNHVVDAGPGVTMSAPSELWNVIDGVSIRAGAHTFRVALEPTTPASTGLTLQAIDQTPALLLGLATPPTEPIVQVSLLGGLWEQQQVRRIEYLVQRPGAWAQSVATQVQSLTRPDLELRPARLPLPADGKQRAIVYLIDGGVMALEADVLGPTPYTVMPTASLTAISHYWGTENGRPHWRADLRIDGLIDAKPTIAAVTFHAENEAGDDVPLDVEGTVATALTPGPLRVSARVTFNDGSEPLTLTGTILTPSETVLPDGQFDVTYQLLERYQAPYNPATVDSFAVPEPVDFVAAYVRAPLRDLQRLQQVTYSANRGWGEPERATVDAAGQGTAEHPLPAGRFAWVLPLHVDSDVTIGATLTLADGTELTQTLSAEAGFDAYPSVVVETQPYDTDPPRWVAAVSLPKSPQAGNADLATAYSIDGTRRDTTFHGPGAPDVFLIDGPIQVTGYWQLLTNPWGEPKTNERNTDALLDPCALRPDALRVDAADGWVRIVPDFNGFAFESATDVRYEVARGGVTTTLRPIAWRGPVHERFAVEFAGDLPDRVTLRAIVDGEDRVGATWQRP